MWSELVAALGAHGWSSETGQPPALACVVLDRADGSRLVLEQRPSNAYWWWVLEGREARAFGLPLTSANLQDVVVELRAHQDTVSIGNYFTAYLGLQKVCDVSIMAWEQFEGSPPFAASAPQSTPGSQAGPDADSGTSGWGNPERSDVGKKRW